jgi:putative ABC transport system permease protein
LKAGVTLAQAQAQMDTIAAGLTAEFPAFDTGWTVRVLSLRDELSGELRPALLTLAGAVAFVLLIACANVANLLLARGAARRRDLAIRTALGAARGRIVRQLLTESAVLGIAGGLLGLLIAQWSLDAVLALSPVDLAGMGHIRLSYPVLAFTALMSFLTALVCGTAPAFEATRVDAHEALAEGGRQVGGSQRAARLRHAFVVAEIALAVVLLVGAGLMLRSFASLQAVDTGMNTHDVLTMRIALPDAKYSVDARSNGPFKPMQFFDSAVQRLAELPGVRSVGRVSFLPFAGLGAATNLTIVGDPPPPLGGDLVTDVSVCDNGYFQTLGIPLLRGRLFTDHEMHEKSNVVVINDAFARRYFAGRDPLGRQVVIAMTNPNVPTTVIGVVGDVRSGSLSADARPTSYWPHPQLPYSAMTLVLRTTGDPIALAPSAEREIHALDKDQPVGDVRTMDQWLARTLAQARFSTLLLMVFAAVAVLLASIGIYGVMSYAVSQRTSEIGIRLALGADGGDILRLVVSTSLQLAGIGLAAGVALALVLTRTLASMLYRTSPADPLTIGAVVALLGAIALLAGYLPARRASHIAPVEALRDQ